MSNILYLGRTSGTSGHRLAALKRMGHQVTQVDPYAVLPQNRFARAWAFKTGNLGLDGYVHAAISKAISGVRFDLALVDNGELISPRTVVTIRKSAGRVAVFNQDNPFSERDGHRWRKFLKALPHYDLYVTPRQSNVEEGLAAGARNVLRSWFSADEVAHSPPSLTPADMDRYGCDVAFVGTWMPERGPFMRALIERGVPLRIYGPRWHKDPDYARIAPFVHEGELKGDDYNKAIAAAKVSLALLSKGNRDLHTTRSMEIPAVGGMLCGERTSEHMQLYTEGQEAEFWNNADECADKCLALLSNDATRIKMAQAGHARCLANNNFNQHWLNQMIASALAC